MPAPKQPQGLLTIEIDPQRRSLVVKARVNGPENAQADVGHTVLFSEASASKCAAALAEELVSKLAAILRRKLKENAG